MRSQDFGKVPNVAWATRQTPDVAGQEYLEHVNFTGTVLLVDDEPLVRGTLADALRDAGFLVVEAADANEALTGLTSLCTVGILVSDITMPGPLNGKELAETVRSRYPDLPIILMSGCAGQLSTTPYNLFLQKPFDVEDLIRGISDVTRRSKSG